MEVKILEPNLAYGIERIFILNMTLHSFKGRKNLEVHLYRGAWEEQEEQVYPWESLLESKDLSDSSKKIILEAFTRKEIEQIIAYLKERYSSRIQEIIAAPLELPLPPGLVPFSKMPENENFGRIYLDKAPHYPLPFTVRGFYDLSSAKPLIDEK